MNLRSVIVLSLSVACADALPPVTSPTIDAPTNNLTDPEPTTEPEPEPEPEPAFQINQGWYEGSVQVDLHIDNPINLPSPIGSIEVNTTCDGIAVFEIANNRVQNGYWECVLPGADGLDLSLQGAKDITHWQGSLLRWLFGTYDTFDCTGELDDGVCSLKGAITGAFDPDTGNITGNVTITASNQGSFNDLVGLVPGGLLQGVVLSWIKSFGGGPLEIDRQSSFAAGYLAETVVDFSWQDDRNVTDVDFDLQSNWVGTTPPPYDISALLPRPE